MTNSAIVIVDDEAIILLSLKQLIKAHFGSRFRYETVMDAGSAIGLIDDFVSEGIEVIIVITDWLMPVIKGDELLRKVHSKHPGIKLIMITGQADASIVEELKKQVKLEGVIMKPWNTAELLVLLDRCVLEAS
ncbi:MAG: hypothetical protein A2Z99_01245 [Treponema sp. GWB1_62_6]|nr:MAG: hypothetical protein A2Y36_02540 [Treponema sp. GWA1_62_8]OHE64231.1 MAG: hypothetical protein A2Z99_01245 [Treponema sp. GWB1_62_6]OHE65139.1 MAG: hypothetical protein A2001_13500 [Treponema sp. GWC1_61_84]